jgi:hypothetical protein
MPSFPESFSREVVRVLRPGGQVVVGHWDWDTQLFDGSDPALVRRIVHAFADWQQAWMARADGWMGRRLWRIFQDAGLVDGTVHARALTNTSFQPGHFGFENVLALEALARRNIISAGDYQRFRAEQEELEATGRFFYSITGFAYVGRCAFD